MVALRGASRRSAPSRRSRRRSPAAQARCRGRRRPCGASRRPARRRTSRRRARPLGRGRRQSAAWRLATRLRQRGEVGVAQRLEQAVRRAGRLAARQSWPAREVAVGAGASSAGVRAVVPTGASESARRGPRCLSAAARPAATSTDGAPGLPVLAVFGHDRITCDLIMVTAVPEQSPSPAGKGSVPDECTRRRPWSTATSTSTAIRMKTVDGDGCGALTRRASARLLTVGMDLPTSRAALRLAAAVPSGAGSCRHPPDPPGISPKRLADPIRRAAPPGCRRSARDDGPARLADRRGRAGRRGSRTWTGSAASWTACLGLAEHGLPLVLHVVGRLAIAPGGAGDRPAASDRADGGPLLRGRR